MRDDGDGVSSMFGGSCVKGVVFTKRASEQRKPKAKRFHEDEEGGDSSGNEYAEGLGCADKRRCRGKVSNFEFDNHAREEYFEWPEQHSGAGESDSDGDSDSEGDARGPSSVSAGASLTTVLADLEREEGRTDTSKLDKERLERRLSVVARRCEARAAKRASPGSARLAPSGGPAACSVGESANGVRASGPGCKNHADDVLKKHRDALAAPSTGWGKVDRRDFFKKHTVPSAPEHGVMKSETHKPAASAPTKHEGQPSLVEHARALMAIRASSHGCTLTTARLDEAAQILAQLDVVQIDAALLKTSGIGVEINHSFWKGPGAGTLAPRCRALIHKWRTDVREAHANRR